MRPGFGSAHLTRLSIRGDGFAHSAAGVAGRAKVPDGRAPEEASERPAPPLGRRKSAGHSGPRAQPPRRREGGARLRKPRAHSSPGDAKRAREPPPSPSALFISGKVAMAAAAASLGDGLEVRHPASKQELVVETAEEATEPAEADINELCKEMFTKMATYLTGELTATSEDYKLLENMNKLTSLKYLEMKDIAINISRNLKDLNQKYAALQPYLEQINQIEEQVAALEQAAYKLDAYSKKLEAKYKKLEKR